MSQRKERPYKLVKNKETGKFEHRTISDREARETIMKAYGLKDQAEYKRFYDVQRNKIYTYNSMIGAKNEIKSVQTFLLGQANSKLRYGQDYEPSEQAKLIQAMPAYSKSKGAKVAGAKSSRSYLNVNAVFKKSIEKNMSGFIKAFSGTKDKPTIVDKINEMYKDDDAKRLKALSAYANKIKEVKKSASGKIDVDYGGYPIGASAGSQGISEFEYDNTTFTE